MPRNSSFRHPWTGLASLLVGSIAAAAPPPDEPTSVLFIIADELYDLSTDPDCVTNLAADAAFAATVQLLLKDELFAELRRQEDPRVLGQGDIFNAYPRPKPAAP